MQVCELLLQLECVIVDAVRTPILGVAAVCPRAARRCSKCNGSSIAPARRLEVARSRGCRSQVASRR